MSLSIYIIYIYSINWLRLILGPCFGRWDMRPVGKTAKRSASASPCGSSPVLPRQSALPVSGRRWVVLSWPSARVSAIELKVGLIHALPKVDTSHPHPCVFVCINLKGSHFSQVSEKKQTLLTYHHNVHKAKVCFGMVFFCPPQRSTKRFFDVGNKSARRVPRNGAFSISNFRRSISAISCSLSLSAYRGVFATIQAHLYVGFQDRRTCRLEEEPTGPLIIFTFFGRE